ncbi:MAG TPA: membrane dipeptidase, partial [Dehalococcoidia bacterium]|nr:membrane dipeptidase [Dehalococcoidia bacterium]
MTTDPNSEIQRARALHDKIPLIDGHNDLPWQYRKVAGNALSKIDIAQHQPSLHTDIPRLREGGVGGQFWSVYIPQTLPKGEHVRATMEQIDVVYNMLRQWPDTFQLSL